MALTLNEIEALTQDKWDPKAREIYLRGNALMYRLDKKKVFYDGGEKIRVVIDYGQPHGGAFNAQSTFDTNKYEEHNAARFKPAYYYEPVTYDMDDVALNSGEAAQVSVIKSKLNKAPKKLRYKMADDLYANSDYGVTGRGLLGLPAMCSASTTYGEISPSDVSEWAATYTTTTEELTFGVIRTLRTACLVGDGMEGEFTLYVTTRTLMDKVKGMLLPQQRFEDEKLANVGFKNVIFEGVPMVGDYKCTSGNLYGLNENYLDLYVHRDWDFKREPWMRPTDQMKFTTQIISVLQLCCSHRTAQGRHTNLS